MNIHFKKLCCSKCYAAETFYSLEEGSITAYKIFSPDNPIHYCTTFEEKFGNIKDLKSHLKNGSLIEVDIL
jgi:hypothetical protein